MTDISVTKPSVNTLEEVGTQAIQPRFVGLLGGTFDPVHLGHVALAQTAQQGLGLDHVRLIPNATPPHRAAPKASSEHRCTMLELAIQGNAALRLDRVELESTQPSYTVNTLQTLSEQLPDSRLLFILGMDAFLHFSKWHQWQRILELCNLVLLSRPEWPLPEKNTAEAGLLHDCIELQAKALTTNAPDARSLEELKQGQIITISGVELHISASHVRECISSGHDPSQMLDTKVWQYIKDHSLYGC